MGRGSAWRAAICTSRKLTPGFRTASASAGFGTASAGSDPDAVLAHLVAPSGRSCTNINGDDLKDFHIKRSRAACRHCACRLDRAWSASTLRDAAHRAGVHSARQRRTLIDLAADSRPYQIGVEVASAPSPRAGTLAGVAWLKAESPDGQERQGRRKAAACLIAGVTLVAAIVAAIVISTDRDDEVPVSHPGRQQAVFRSADGQIEAAVYWINSSARWSAVTEVVVRPAGVTADHAMVSFGCTEDDNGLDIVAVTVETDSIVARNYNGAQRMIRFDPRTLRPEATLGPC